MPDQFGRVSVTVTEPLLTFTLDQVGTLEMVGGPMRTKLSPQALHNLLHYLNSQNYSRAVCISRKKWHNLIEAINEHMMNVYDAGDGEDEDIQKIQAVLDTLEDGLL